MLTVRRGSNALLKILLLTSAVLLLAANSNSKKAFFLGCGFPSRRIGIKCPSEQTGPATNQKLLRMNENMHGKYGYTASKTTNAQGYKYFFP